LLYFVAVQRDGRTPNPLILVRGFATTLDGPRSAGLTSTYSSSSIKLASRRFVSLLVQRGGLKGGFRGLIDTYVSRRLPPTRIDRLGMPASEGYQQTVEGRSWPSRIGATIVLTCDERIGSANGMAMGRLRIVATEMDVSTTGGELKCL
jgi:hypothetical protein